jgi:hypothetical protein
MITDQYKTRNAMTVCLHRPAVRGPAGACAGFALTLLVASSAAVAQAPAAPGEVSSSFNLTGLSQLSTKIDDGGRFRWNSVDLGGSVTRQFTPELSLGVNARYIAEYWSFDTPTAFGAVAPWTDVLRPSVGLSLGYSLAPDLSMFVAPQVEWAYESGASASEGLNYGAVVGVTKVFSRSLFVGLGLGAFRQIDRMQYFPFVIVNWQIDDAWRLSNPLQAGPAGGAGLELAYTWGDDWELAGGAAYRDYRFRLRSDAPIPNGLGQNSGAPVFARLTRKFGPVAQVDLYMGAVVGGQLKVRNEAGSTVQSSNYSPAPFFALSGSIRF